MIKLEKKQVKIVSILIAVVFIGSVVALALTQSGGVASAAASDKIGVVSSQELLPNHPGFQNARSQFEAAVTEIQKDFETKSAGMSDQEKQDYYVQCQQRAQQKERELMDPLVNNIRETIQKVAEAKGLTIVIDKTAVLYGGQDITQDVVAKLGK